MLSVPSFLRGLASLNAHTPIAVIVTGYRRLLRSGWGCRSWRGVMEVPEQVEGSLATGHPVRVGWGAEGEITLARDV
jgi:hypothetical protein